MVGDVADSSVVCGKGREGGYWVLGLMTEHPSLPRKGDQAMGARRPRRRYNRNVELVLGIVVIAVVVALLVWLID